MEYQHIFALADSTPPPSTRPSPHTFSISFPCSHHMRSIILSKLLLHLPLARTNKWRYNVAAYSCACCLSERWPAGKSTVAATFSSWRPRSHLLADVCPALSGVWEQVFPYILGLGLFPVLALTLSPLYHEFQDEMRDCKLTTNGNGCNGSHLCKPQQNPKRSDSVLPLC